MAIMALLLGYWSVSVTTRHCHIYYHKLYRNTTTTTTTPQSRNHASRAARPLPNTTTQCLQDHVILTVTLCNTTNLRQGHESPFDPRTMISTTISNQERRLPHSGSVTPTSIPESTCAGRLSECASTAAPGRREATLTQEEHRRLASCASASWSVLEKKKYCTNKKEKGEKTQIHSWKK